MQINSAKDLKVYKVAYDLAMRIFELTKSFPPEERFALTRTDQTLIAFSLLEFARGMGEAEI